MAQALLDERGLDQLRHAIAGYTADAIHELVGPVGQAALGRGDLAGVARLARGRDRLCGLIRLFLLGVEVPAADARAALAPLPLDTACAAGLVLESGGTVRAVVDVRPYGDSWWVVSDFGADIRGGPLPADHVLGVGAASVTLAQATPRLPVGRALDIGTGCGVQSLHLGTHAGDVTATDVSPRALRLAATTAALSGQEWDLRRGSLLEPVAGDRFDLVVANPPFVVSDGGGGYDYRDSGLRGDAACADLVTGLPGVLAEGGCAQLLANWVIRDGEPWRERVAGWLTGRGCDAWVWQREVAEPGEYVSLWLRDAGETPGSPRWAGLYGAWVDWLTGAGIAAIGMGLVTMWRTDVAEPVVVLEDVPQGLEQPIGAQLPGWLARQRWLAAHDDTGLLAARLRAGPGIVRERTDVLDDAGWSPALAQLRQTGGLRWTVEVDEPIAALVAGCVEPVALTAVLGVLAAALDRPAAEIAQAALPVVRDLVSRGFLEPEGLA